MDINTGQIKPEDELSKEEKGDYIPFDRKLTPKEQANLKVDKYSPCACGSGKKFKFCCYRKKKIEEEKQAQIKIIEKMKNKK